MSSFRVMPIQAEIAQAVRDTRLSPFAEHPTYVETARGYGPCRLCLKTFVVGVESRILFTYDPFDALEPFPLPGPIFIHESACEPFPTEGGFPESMRSRRVTLLGYGKGAVVRQQERVTNAKPAEAVERMLADVEVRYIHVRDTDAGCYDFRIERVTSAGD